MYEVEVKIPADLDSVRSEIAKINADFIGRVSQTDIYFDHPDRSFAETDEALRIRYEKPLSHSHLDYESQPQSTQVATYLTYKGPRVNGNSKTRSEIETRVTEREAIGELIRALGFEQAIEIHKIREQYASEEFLIALDRVTGLGEFVEIEAREAMNDITNIESDATAFCEQIGLNPRNHVPSSYLELVLNA